MGTTESILYSDEEDVSEQSAESVSDHNVVFHRPHHTVAATTQAPRPLRPPPQNPSVAARRNERRRPPKRHPTTATPPLLRLTGVIMGLPKSGKQCLMQRLRGKDPFVAGLEKVFSACVPYQAPRNQEIWDRIQLDVSIIGKQNSNNQHSVTDFAVLVIDPRHDRDRTQQYISESVEYLLKAQNITVESDSSSGLQKPFCLCFLINFADKTARLNNKDDPTLKISESDIQKATLLSLQEHCPGLEPARMHLQCCCTSLFNCYGLGILHHFIYESYLLHKHLKLQESLRLVQQSLAQSRNVGPPVIPYENFLKQLQAPTRNDSEGPMGTTKRDDVAGAAKSNKPKRERKRAIVAPKEEEVKSLAPVNDAEASRKALEAFLASDDEEDTKNRQVMDSDNDDDDDEVFYDESGHRGTAATATVATTKPQHQLADISAKGNETEVDSSQTLAKTTTTKSTQEPEAQLEPQVADSADSDKEETATTNASDSEVSSRVKEGTPQKKTTVREPSPEYDDHRTDSPVGHDDYHQLEQPSSEGAPTSPIASLSVDKASKTTPPTVARATDLNTKSNTNTNGALSSAALAAIAAAQQEAHEMLRTQQSSPAEFEKKAKKEKKKKEKKEKKAKKEKKNKIQQ